MLLPSDHVELSTAMGLRRLSCLPPAVLLRERLLPTPLALCNTSPVLLKLS